MWIETFKNIKLDIIMQNIFRGNMHFFGGCSAVNLFFDLIRSSLRH